MCSSKPKPAPTPAAAPPPPVEGPTAPVLNEAATSEKTTLSAKRAGRGSLRIDLAESTPSDSSGLNIPTA